MFPPHYTLRVCPGSRASIEEPAEFSQWNQMFARLFPHRTAIKHSFYRSSANSEDFFLVQQANRKNVVESKISQSLRFSIKIFFLRSCMRYEQLVDLSCRTNLCRLYRNIFWESNSKMELKNQKTKCFLVEDWKSSHSSTHKAGFRIKKKPKNVTLYLKNSKFTIWNWVPSTILSVVAYFNVKFWRSFHFWCQKACTDQLIFNVARMYVVYIKISFKNWIKMKKMYKN